MYILFGFVDQYGYQYVEFLGQGMLVEYVYKFWMVYGIIIIVDVGSYDV